MIEIQEGLLVEDYEKLIDRKFVKLRNLVAKEGYHFYDIEEYEEQLKFYNESEYKSEEKPKPNYCEKMYLAKSMISWRFDELNAKFKSVKKEI